MIAAYLELVNRVERMGQEDFRTQFGELIQTASRTSICPARLEPRGVRSLPDTRPTSQRGHRPRCLRIL